jgi:hypothetical protein
MSAYQVSFFKNLLSSDGHPFKCLQRRIDIGDAETAAQAAESASRAFEALHIAARRRGDRVATVALMSALPLKKA